jgi:PmbA protein
MNNKERLELAKWASHYAQKKGANQAAVSISRSRSVQIEVRGQKLENIRESTDNNLSLQIYRDNKFSSHSTNNLNKVQLERFISEAVNATAYLSPDKDRQLPDPSLYPNDLSFDLGLYDSGHEQLTPEYRIEQAMETEKRVRQSNANILSVSASFSDNSSESVRVHTNGFIGEQAGTFFSAGSSITIMDAGSRPAGGFFGSGRFLSKLPSPEIIAEKALFDVTRQIGQGQIQSGKYTMIIDNRVAGSLLSRLFQPLSGRNIQQKNSFLLDMLDKQIASEHLTLIDDPMIPGGIASRLYDGEGIAAKRRVIVENGILKTYLLDNYYGRKLNLLPNGGSTSNILLGHGNRSQNEIIAAQDRAILITSFNGGNANVTTGDFSFGISGQFIQGGKIVRSVNEMNITGNFLNMWNQLVETGNDPYEYSSMRTPTMVFRDIDFSGL